MVRSVEVNERVLSFLFKCFQSLITAWCVYVCCQTHDIYQQARRTHTHTHNEKKQRLLAVHNHSQAS